MNGFPYHADPENAKNCAGDGCPDGTEPAFCEVSEEKSEQGHAALEYPEAYCLEHGAAVLDSRFRKPCGDRDREAVHRLDNCDDDNFYDTHN